jgi:hypothetical protein
MRVFYLTYSRHMPSQPCILTLFCPSNVWRILEVYKEVSKVYQLFIYTYINPNLSLSVTNLYVHRHIYLTENKFRIYSSLLGLSLLFNFPNPIHSR